MAENSTQITATSTTAAAAKWIIISIEYLTDATSVAAAAAAAVTERIMHVILHLQLKNSGKLYNRRVGKNVVVHLIMRQSLFEDITASKMKLLSLIS